MNVSRSGNLLSALPVAGVRFGVLNQTVAIRAVALGRLHLVAAGELGPDRRERHRVAFRVARRRSWRPMRARYSPRAPSVPCGGCGAGLISVRGWNTGAKLLTDLADDRPLVLRHAVRHRRLRAQVRQDRDDVRVAHVAVRHEQLHRRASVRPHRRSQHPRELAVGVAPDAGLRVGRDVLRVDRRRAAVRRISSRRRAPDARRVPTPVDAPRSNRRDTRRSAPARTTRYSPRLMTAGSRARVQDSVRGTSQTRSQLARHVEVTAPRAPRPRGRRPSRSSASLASIVSRSAPAVSRRSRRAFAHRRILPSIDAVIVGGGT